MVKFALFTIVGTLVCFPAARAAAAEGGAVTKAFLERHCAACHDEDNQKGKFRVDTLPDRANTPDAENRWGRVLSRLEAGEMPPPKRERPPADEVSAALSWMKAELASAAKAHRADGRVRIRRLNRTEYENTLQDLLGVRTSVRDMLPEDDTADGFDTGEKALSVSPVHVQRYMDAAEAALRAAVVHGPRPETKTYHFTFDDPSEKTYENLGHGHNKTQIPVRDGKVWFYQESHIEVPIHSMQFRQVTRKVPGRYKFRVSVRTDDNGGKPLAFSLYTTRSKKLLGYFDAQVDKPGVIEVEHDFLPDDKLVIAPYNLRETRRLRNLNVFPKPDGTPWDNGPAIVVDWVEAEGPLFPAWPPASHERLFGGVPMKPAKDLPKGTLPPTGVSGAQLTPQSDNPLEDARRLLTPFLGRAFRRPVTADDVEPYVGLVKDRLAQNVCFETAMLSAYQTAVCSPDFLFLVQNPGPLDDHALACRLSYFLTRTAPDETLRAAADRGELRKPDVLRREAERLLDSPRATAFVNDFLDHWLRLRDMDATMPDKELFPEYYLDLSAGKIDGLLREAMAAETRLFFADLLKRDGSLMNLVDSDYTFANSRLAEFYGLPPVTGVDMRRVPLPADSVRGGVLTQASVLKVTANGSRSSPVVRGAWVLESIIGRPPPPPPPDAGSIEPDTRGATTIREQLAKHQASTTCASCHVRIDPPGFALEAFDPIGQYRTYYRATEVGQKLEKGTNNWRGHWVKYLKGPSVDPSGVMPGDHAFAGPREFKKLLLKDADPIARNVAAKLVTFATGHHAEPGDVLALDGVVERAKAKQYGLRTLLLEVVQSELFTNK
jgi:mono/diheme cytochrome c family protein